MYKVDVKTRGKYNNVETGAVYVFSKRKAKRCIIDYLNTGCKIDVTKFVKCGDVWTWSYDHKLYGGYWEEGDWGDEDEDA